MLNALMRFATTFSQRKRAEMRIALDKDENYFLAKRSIFSMFVVVVAFFFSVDSYSIDNFYFTPSTHTHTKHQIHREKKIEDIARKRKVDRKIFIKECEVWVKFEWNHSAVILQQRILFTFLVVSLVVRAFISI